MLQTWMWRSVLHALLCEGGRLKMAPHFSSTFIKHAGVCVGGGVGRMAVKVTHFQLFFLFRRERETKELQTMLMLTMTTYMSKVTNFSSQSLVSSLTSVVPFLGSLD